LPYHKKNSNKDKTESYTQGEKHKRNWALNRLYITMELAFQVLSTVRIPSNWFLATT
jgi:hypothetical protein